MTISSFLRSLEQALEVDSGSITATQTLKGVEWWDSMAALTFMAVADQELQVTISGGQLQQCKTVSDLVGLLGDKLTP